MGTDAHWDFQSIVHIPIFKLGSVTWVGIYITCHNFCKSTISQLIEKGFPGGSGSKESAYNVGDLGLFWEDPLEEAIHSSILAWRIPMDRGAGLLWGHKEPDMTEQLSTYI